jgi:hypothetical protein
MEFGIHGISRLVLLADGSEASLTFVVIDKRAFGSGFIFAATDEEFEAIFPAGADIEFIEDFVERVGDQTVTRITLELWKRSIAKKDVRGIHGALFYELAHKKRYYPTKKESEMVLAL